MARKKLNEVQFMTLEIPAWGGAGPYPFSDFIKDDLFFFDFLSTAPLFVRHSEDKVASELYNLMGLFQFTIPRSEGPFKLDMQFENRNGFVVYAQLMWIE